MKTKVNNKRPKIVLITGWYDKIEKYNITDNNDPWKINKEGKPFGNDLTTLNETTGFWIHITRLNDIIFFYNGSLPFENQTVYLRPGWNLVGYPSLNDRNRTDALNGLIFGKDIVSIWTYNSGDQKWVEIKDTDFFEVGKGYWVYSMVKINWDVPL